MINFYVILGVPPSATEEEIKLRYRELTRVYHPDRGGDTAVFQAITEAGSALSDPYYRRRFDNALRLLMDPCPQCFGSGVKVIQKSLIHTTKEVCHGCQGGGYFQRGGSAKAAERPIDPTADDR